MNTNTDTENIVRTVTVPEGIVRRQYEQTASRDHNVTLVPGVYEVTTKRYRESGRMDRFYASIPAIAHNHTASTVEFGGIALAWEQRGGETENYGWSIYGYQATDVDADSNLTLS